MPCLRVRKHALRFQPQSRAYEELVVIVTRVVDWPAEKEDVKKIKKDQIKSLLLSHHQSTCALVSEIIERVLQTVQKQFTYRQYILTDLYRRQCAEYTYIYSVHTVLLRHTYSYQYTLCTVCTHFTLCTHKYTQYAKVKQILHRPDMQCHGCALHVIQW